MDRGNVNNLDCANKYIQGSIWKWARRESAADRPGAPLNERLVLIISNDTFNLHSQSVNCVSITNILKESPVHIPLYTSTDSHIQCEQIHTISKAELVDYRGAVQPPVLSNIKAKIRIQFNMSEDRSAEMFSSIKKSIDELKAKTAAGFGVPELESEFVKFLTNIHNSYEEIKTDIASIRSAIGKPASGGVKIRDLSDYDEDENEDEDDVGGGEDEDEDEKIIRSPKFSGSRARSRGKQRKYTKKDRIFIADPENSIEELVNRYGYSKQYAYKMRKYFQKRLGISVSDSKVSDEDDGAASYAKDGGETENRQKRTRYSDEDIEFITNTANPINLIVEKYGFSDNIAASRARSYLKRTYSKIKNKNQLND